MSLLKHSIEKDCLKQIVKSKTRNECDRIILNMWSDILEVNSLDIDIDDNFFEIGGQSMLASMMIIKANQIFKYKCSIKDVYSYPTIRMFSDYIRRMGI